MNKGKICVPVCARTAEEMISGIEKAAEFADVIELRFDCLDEVELDKAIKMVADSKCIKPFLATYRPFEQGGNNPALVSDDLHKREGFFSRTRKRAEFKFVDSEFDFPIAKTYFKNSVGIVSFHDFTGLADDLEAIYRKVSDVVKIAVQSNEITDAIPVWKLLDRAKKDNKEIIPIAMGEAGKWTRILGPAHGAYMTYASLDDESGTAPGQITAKDMRDVYRVKELDLETEVYGIIGGNTSVSLSPYIHNAAFKHAGRNAVYVPLQVNNLDEFMRRMVLPATHEVELNFCGFSVTIPHKQTIMQYLDEIDETARAIGAVNTVNIEDGKLYGYNTDAEGFIEPLRKAYGDLSNARVALLGAGGAARACIYAFKNAGANVTIFARNLDKVKLLADEFGVALNQLPITNNQLLNFDILVNSTPIGMKVKSEGESPIAAESLRGMKLVYDLIYTPEKTKLITDAEQLGIKTLGGMEMLLGQAAMQQKIWTNS